MRQPRSGRDLSYDARPGGQLRAPRLHPDPRCLLDELRSSDWASRSVRSRARQLQQAGEELTGRLGRSPTRDELAAELGTDAQTVHKLVDRERRADLSAAVLALPERLRAVVISYFYEQRPMLEIVGELGVTSRASSSSGPRPWSCSGTGSTPTWTRTPRRPRLDAAPRPLPQRAAEAGPAAPSPA
jgi:Sigma-70 region 3